MTLTMEEQKAFFLLMGIPGNGVNVADEDSLKKAFRNKAMDSHPDRAASLGKDPRIMQMRFQELNDAFNILMERLNREKTPYTVRSSGKSGAAGKTETPTGKQNKHKASGTAYQAHGNDASSGGTAGKAQSRHQSRKKPHASASRTAGTHSGKTKSADEAKTRKSRKAKKAIKEDFYYSGRTPERNLRFAEYLYYSGSISWTDLVQALVWQYRNRPKLGELATATGLLAFDDVLDVIKDKKAGELFGEAAVRLGYMDRQNLDALIRKQKQLGLPIGRYFVSSNKMSQDVLYKKLSENRRHNIIFEEE